MPRRLPRHKTQSREKNGGLTILGPANWVLPSSSPSQADPPSPQLQALLQSWAEDPFKALARTLKTMMKRTPLAKIPAPRFLLQGLPPLPNPPLARARIT